MHNVCADLAVELEYEFHYVFTSLAKQHTSLKNNIHHVTGVKSSMIYHYGLPISTSGSPLE